MYNKGKIKIYFNEKQAITQRVGFSQSPNKPKLLLEHLIKRKLSKHFGLYSDFKPYNKEDFKLAHSEMYIDNFFSGTGNCQSNGLTWNKEFARSVRYTNASLYEAIKGSILNPKQISFSPTSGFHHATPNSGGGFCTFSGQVIASVKLYNEYGVRGAYLDLDGHFGNSIEDSRNFVSDLDYIIPKSCNINPSGSDKSYLENLKFHLINLSKKILKGEVQYVVACSGADSIDDDDLGGQVNFQNWLKAKKMIYSTLLKVSQKMGKPVPLTISLFGGYRKDDYNSVLEAHTMDLLTCMNILQDKDIISSYQCQYKKSNKTKWRIDF